MQVNVSQAGSPLTDSSRLLSNCRLAARAAGLVGICVGLSVLVGWLFDIPRLRAMITGYSAMVPNTALGLLLCGVVLWLDHSAQTRRIALLLAQVCAAIVCVIGLGTLIQYALERDLGINGLLFPESVMQLAPSRMAIMSAASFVLLGSALFLLPYRRAFLVGQYVAIVAGVLCLFNAIGYLYGIRGFYVLAFSSGSTAMAVHASLTFVVLCCGTLLSRPDWGLMSTLTNPAPGGVMARRLLPAAMLIPVTVGWFRWQGQQRGFYDTAFGLALSTAVNVVIFAFLIWRCAQMLNRLDIERAKAEISMRQLADAMPLMVWTTNSDGESDYFNQRCYDYCCMTFEQIRDGGWVSTIHPDEVRSVMDLRGRAFTARLPYSMEYRFRRAADGMYRWHLAQANPLFDARGNVARWVGTCTDIHSIRLAEDAVRHTEFQFRQLADSMPQIVWTATPDGNIDYYNQRWHEYTGMTFEESRDWSWAPVLHPSDLQDTIRRWAAAVTAFVPYEVEHRFRRADGVYRWHLGRAQAIRDPEGAVVRWFGTCTDIEDYKRAEAEIRILNEGLEERVRERTAQLDQSIQQLAVANEELKGSTLRLVESNRELQDFASVASHDLQEPLRKVQAFGDRLKTVCSSEALGEQGRDYLDRMLNATKRMQSLIQDLLAFARITSQASAFKPVDLTRIIGEVLSDLEVRIAETDAQVEVGDLPAIDADAVQMRQLLQNLIGNALKFHQAGKPPGVRVYAEKTGFPADGMCRIVVADQGIGFDEKYLDRIFSVFQRLHGRSEYEGTGVGLAICRKIAQRHGGYITAKSSPGQGASFVVTLPCSHAEEDRISDPGASADMNLGKLYAALADDAVLTLTNEKLL